MNKRSLTKKNGRRIQCIWAVLVLTISLLTVPAMAADDPLSIVNNLSDFIFSPSAPRGSCVCLAGC